MQRIFLICVLISISFNMILSETRKFDFYFFFSVKKIIYCIYKMFRANEIFMNLVKHNREGIF